MPKFIYGTSEGNVEIVTAVPKKNLEKQYGPLTAEEYSAIIMKTIPENARNLRRLSTSDVPQSREFRNAWTDVKEGTQVDIRLEGVRDILLETLRQQRNKDLADTDVEYVRALEEGKDLEGIKEKRSRLRDATLPLKQAKMFRKHNSETTINRLKILADLPKLISKVRRHNK